MELIESMNVDTHVKNYEEVRPLYESYAAKIRHLLISLLDAHQVKYQIVETRSKDLQSFKEKITRVGKKYDDPISQITDLCGARVIVYYNDDVAKVAEMISKEFEIVQEEKLHQADSFDPDRFGYLSRHFITKLNVERSNLSEWKFAQELNAEIQVRTVIQHAWSAVSHALQYKQETSIPSKLSRRLYRIAGLFELADEEFVGIRDNKNRLVDAATTAFAEGNRDIPITSETITALVNDNSIMSNLVDSAESVGFSTEEKDDYESVIPEIYDISKRLGLNKISELEAALHDDFSKHFRGASKVTQNWNPPREYLVFIALLGKKKNLISVDELEEHGWNSEWAERLLRAVAPKS